MNKQVEAIRTEIERRIKFHIRLVAVCTEFGLVYAAEANEYVAKQYKDFLTFIDSQPEEHQPIDSNKTIEPSEDEKVRQEIVEYLKLVGKGDDDYAQPMIDRWFVWLERQKKN